MNPFWQGVFVGAVLFGGAGAAFGWAAWNRKAKLVAAIKELPGDVVADVKAAAAKIGLRI